MKLFPKMAMHVWMLLWMSLGVAAFAAAAGSADPAGDTDGPALSTIDGTWRWTFTMPDGTTTSPRLILESHDGQLTGTSSFRPGTEMAITNGVLSGNVVRFQVVRVRGDQRIVTTYSGVWAGNVIRGQVRSNWAGEDQSYPWEARRPHEGAEGLWRWTTVVRGRRVPGAIRLVQDGEKLTGSVPGSGRGARRIRISNGSVKHDEVSFEIVRGAGDAQVITSYRGKQVGDTIRGIITTIAAGRKVETPWEAHRAD